MTDEHQYKTKQLGLTHVRTLKMTDDVLAVKYSPDGRFLAVSLLDSTVKVFFQDSLKFFLSLYGHKVCLLCTIAWKADTKPPFASTYYPPPPAFPSPSFPCSRSISRQTPS